MLRECVTCKKKKPLKEFYRVKWLPGGYSTRCLLCQWEVIKLGEELMAIDDYAAKVITIMEEFGIIPHGMDENVFLQFYDRIARVFTEQARDGRSKGRG